jgi:hypothetical protein
MQPTLSEASRVGISPFDKGANFPRMNFGLEGRQSIFRYSNALEPREAAFLSSLLACEDSQGVTHNDFESYARHSWDETFPFAAGIPKELRNVRICYHC